ncbi:NAD-dependent epimerase/dehydratase family protein [Arcobacter sp. FWKO B]|uniref:NAD-dependent epimerase/dehydratase family protein n=1 Tax=Arcobacter sp. FWKO B TaxID=2593672 RepID=UPI0018A6129A|nr:NAD(P)-dependent oxidoreductase [Arcobacter sp. FWKO B]QOG12165.1 NAD(P)-dependent oxidoreductase [Arcobacter sp. FWKO B]
MQNYNKKIYIIGSTGFVGKELEYYLSLQDGYDIKGLSSKECNLLCINSINNALKEIDENTILVVTSSITRLVGNNFDTFCKNIKMIYNLSVFLKNQEFRQLIFLSTLDIYGNQNKVIVDDLSPKPHDYYSLSKLVSEDILLNLLSNTKLTIFRLQGVFGDYKCKSTLNNIINGAFNSKNINIVNGGHSYREFIYINNLLLIIKYAIDNQIDGIYNISCNKSMQIIEYVNLICDNIDFHVDLTFLESKTNRDYNVVVDSEKFHEKFHKIHFISTEKAIHDIIVSTVINQERL